jgi:hypothetical protein
MDAEQVREEIDRRVRPGQPGGSTTADRMPMRAALKPGAQIGATRWDWGSGELRTYALYGRGKYATGRYLSG